MRRAGPLLVAVLAAGGVRAAPDEATRFLLVPAAARSVGLAGASAAVADDADAARSNPAGLARLGHSEVALTHARYVLFIKGGEVAAAVPVPGLTLGLHAAYLEDDQEGRDEAGGGLRYFQNRHATVAAVAGWSAGARLDLGLGVRYVQVALADAVARGAALEGGGLWHGDGGWTASLSARHLGVMGSFGGERVGLPARYGAGVARRLDARHLVLAGEAWTYAAGGAGGSLGGEWRAARLTVFRAGVGAAREGPGADWRPVAAFGFGLGVERWGLDYAATPLGGLGSAQRFSLRAAW